MTDAVATHSPRREATRQRLMDAAAQVFAEVGLDAASVEAVCERAGFTRGAFYSNFETKDELFLELAGRVAQERVDSVRERVRELERAGELSLVHTNALEIVQRVLDVPGDERLNVLLMSEIRIHALRDPGLAAAFLAQEEAMLVGVTQIIDDLGSAKELSFRLPAAQVARLMLTVWDAAAVRAVMAGSDPALLQRATNEELARIADLLIERGGS